MSSDATTRKHQVHFRRMERQDIPEIERLERKIFSDPWPHSAFMDVVTEPGWQGLVAESDGTIIGYACYLFVDVEAHLANIAVVESHRRKSVAKQLLNGIFEDVINRQCDFILLEVRPSNKEALAFYEKYGFRVLYRRPNYYRRPVEDAIVMVRYLEDKKPAD